MGCKTSEKLLIAIVRRSRADRVVEIVRKAGAGGSTTVFGKGTASSSFLRFLCLADVEKELVFTVASSQIMANIKHSLEKAPDLCAKMPGIGIIMNVNNFFRLGMPITESSQPNHTNLDNERKEMQQERSLLFIVTNTGLADELIDLARKAGARGGTILKARGTARGEDSSFFGITIVPEKEILLILVEKEDEEEISGTIKKALVNDQPGVGIMFSLPVEDFFALGLKNNT